MTTPDPANVARLAAAFAERLQGILTPEQWATMCERNATPAYAGDVCASHDFCDANEVMLAAFVRTFGRDLVWPCDVDEGASQADHDRDFALWNAAFAMAKRDHFTAPPADPYDAMRDAMSGAFQNWTRQQGEGFDQGDASELLFHPNLTDAQRCYLTRFIAAWDALAL